MIRKVAQFFILAVVLILFYGLSNQIYHALQAGKRLDGAASKLANLQRKNNELKKKLAEADSLAFIEIQARDKLNLSRPGESVIVISEKEIDRVLGISESTPSVKILNWQGWLKLLFRYKEY